jgi:streptogramin lyase
VFELEPMVGFAGFNLSMILVLFATRRLGHGRVKLWLRGIGLVASAAFLIGLLVNPVSAAVIAEYWYGPNPARPWEVACDVSANRAFYTAQMSNRIGLVEWGAGKFTEWTIPTTGSMPWGIALGPEIFTDMGTFVWFTENVGNKIGRLNPITGEFVEWQTSDATVPQSAPRDIAIDRPRLTVWYTEFEGRRIGKLKYEPGDNWRMTRYPIPGNLQPNHITVDADGIVWFTALPSHIGRFNPWKGEFTMYLVPNAPNGIAYDKDGFIWFTSIGENMICRLDWWKNQTVGWTIPSSGSYPAQLIVDQDYNVWFTEFAAAKIGKFVPGTANFYEYPTPSSGSQPYGICMHSADTIVFTEAQSNRLGRLFQPAWMAGGVDTKTTTVDFIIHATGTTITTATLTTSSRITVASTVPVPVTAFTTSTSTAWSTTSSTVTETKSVLYTSSTTTKTETSTSTTITTTTTSTTTSRTSTTTETSTTTTTTSTTETSTTTETSSSTTTVTYPTTTFWPTITSIYVTSWTSTSTSITTLTTQTTTTSTSTVVVTRLTTTTATPTARQCIIASAAHGSELAPEVQFLRMFRDQSVQSTFAGSAFMNAFNAFYYSFSPTVASTITRSPVLQEAVKVLLYPLMAALHSAASVFDALALAPELAAALSGLVASGLIGILYLSPLAIAVAYTGSRRSRRFH